MLVYLSHLAVANTQNEMKKYKINIAEPRYCRGYKTEELYFNFPYQGRFLNKKQKKSLI